MASNQRERCGVFIDGSNVFWGSKSMPPESRWWIDYAKFKNYLKEQYRPVFYQYYGAVDTNPTSPVHAGRAKRQQKMYSRLSGLGYEVITKPLKYIRTEAGHYITKGDMDIELTMGIMRVLDDIDMIVLVSGDSDYLAAVSAFQAQGKSVRIISFNNLLSWELRTFALANPRCSFTVLDSLEAEIKYGGR